MQIGFNTLPTLPVPANYRRDELDERRQQRNQAAVTQQSQPQQATGEVTRIRPRPISAAQSADNSLPKFSDNLPARARNAVAAYSSNGPSIEERLGVELVGVDLYA